MIHTYFLQSEKYYMVTEDTPCFPGQESDILEKGKQYYCKSRDQIQSIEYLVLQELVGGEPTGDTFLYRLSGRKESLPDRHHFCAINPNHLPN